MEILLEELTFCYNQVIDKNVKTIVFFIVNPIITSFFNPLSD